MPIYEFYCPGCNTIYKFFSRSVNTEKIPECPHCEHRQLERRMSMFSMGAANPGDDPLDEGMPQFDETKLEKAISALASEANKIDEDDPRQAAQLMRKLSAASGLKMGSGMEEALRRLEQGENPEQIEAEMGDLLESEDPFLIEDKHSKNPPLQRPNIDEKIYDM